MTCDHYRIAILAKCTGTCATNGGGFERPLAVTALRNNGIPVWSKYGTGHIHERVHQQFHQPIETPFFLM